MPKLTRMDGKPAATTSSTTVTTTQPSVSFSPPRGSQSVPAAEGNGRREIPAQAFSQGGWGGTQWGPQPMQGWTGQEWNNPSCWQGGWPQSWGQQVWQQQPGWQMGFNPTNWQAPVDGQQWGGSSVTRGAGYAMPTTQGVEVAPVGPVATGQGYRPLTPITTPPPPSSSLGMEREESFSESGEDSPSDSEAEETRDKLSFSDKVLKVKAVLGLPVDEETEERKICSFDTTATSVTPGLPPSEMFLQYCGDWHEKLRGKNKATLKADVFPNGAKVRWECYRVTGESWSGEALRAPDILDTPLFPHSQKPYLKLSHDTCMGWETGCRNTMSCLNFSEYFIGTSRKMLEETLKVLSKPEVSGEEIATLRAEVGQVQELLGSAGRGIHDAVKSTIDRLGQAVLIRRDAWQSRMAAGIDLGAKEKLRAGPIVGTKSLFQTEHLQEALDSSSKTESHKVNQVILTQHKRKPESGVSKKPYDRKATDGTAYASKGKRAERSERAGGYKGKRSSFRGKGRKTDSKDKK